MWYGVIQIFLPNGAWCMRPDPFSDPGDDGQEPDSCQSSAQPDTEPAQQGLFLCLPAGSLDADQFAQSGPAADMPPDPLLSTVIDTVTGEDGKGLAGLSDDQLIGVIAAGRRLESRAAWYVMAAVREFAARNTGEGRRRSSPQTNWPTSCT